MPVVACTRNGKKGYKYGQAGKCYTYNAGDEKGRKKAKQQAYLQGAAIEANTGENELNKYNTCHGPKGRFCGTGGGAGVAGAAFDDTDVPLPAPKPKEPEPETGLTMEEQRVLKEYVGPEFAFINAYSRQPAGGNAADKEMYLKKAEVLDSAFKHTPPLKGEEIVYRGFNPPKQMMDQLVKGAVIEDRGFMSTTIDRGVAKNFGSTVMTIRIPKGAKAINIRDYIKGTTADHEKEMLLPRGTKLQITHVRQEAGGFLGMGKKLSIEARVIQ